MGQIEREGLISGLKVKFSHSLFFEKLVLFLFGFPTICLIEERFSAANDELVKKCNLLQIKKRRDLCLKLNKSLEVQFDKLI